MGLDLLDFVLEIEEAFEFRFPDEDVAAITTPRRLIDYLAERLPGAADPVCMSQQIFYRLRHAVAARLDRPARDLRPDTPLLPLIPVAERAAFWEGVRHDMGAQRVRPWPRLADAGWFDAFRAPHIATLRAATQVLTARTLRPLKLRGGGWTRGSIAETVHAIMCERFGLRGVQYTEDTTWREMGVD